MFKYKKNSDRKRKFLSLFIKIFILLFSFYYLKIKLADILKDNFLQELIENFNFFYVIMPLCLMFVNWGLESYKWKLLVSKIVETDIFSCIKTVLISLYLGLFTPNRIGELAGRVVLLENKDKMQGVIMATIGSYSQGLVTFFNGCLAACLFVILHNNHLKIESDIIRGLLILASVLMIIVAVISFFHLHRIGYLLIKIKKLERFAQKIIYISEYKRLELLKILILSLLRYFVFWLQYYIFLKMFDINISFFNAYLSISLTYFAISYIPSIVLFDLGIRSAAAVFFIGIFTESNAEIVSVTIVMWFINILLPALSGLLFFVRTPIHK